uniref:Ig-like domain-containing protein n=1 Tax=Timema genevievae TaxID=629358 RepID=A0A7R9KA37_TIMGE|nr:unnamed protein product [Timema genevievae]
MLVVLSQTTEDGEIEVRISVGPMRISLYVLFSCISVNASWYALFPCSPVKTSLCVLSSPGNTSCRVQTLPVIKRELKDMRCCDGDSVTLECRVQATPTPDIRWEKGGRLLPLGGDFVSEFDGETARLTIHQVYPEDEGEYTCVAYSDLGRAATSACLVVDVAPNLPFTRLNLTHCFTENLEAPGIEPGITGSVARNSDHLTTEVVEQQKVPEEKETLLSRQLSRPPGLLSAGSTPRSTPRTTPSRSISPSVPRQHHRDQDSTPSRYADGERPKRLKLAAPKFYAIPHNRVAEEGETVRFQCAIAGHPSPWVTWDKDGLLVTPSARLTLKEKDDLRVLEVAEVTPEDAGLYRVTLENEVGRVEASARLEVIVLQRMRCHMHMRTDLIWLVLRFDWFSRAEDRVNPQLLWIHTFAARLAQNRNVVT